MEQFILKHIGAIIFVIIGGLIVYIYKKQEKEVERVKSKNDEIEKNYIDRFDKVNASIRQQTEILTEQINGIKEEFVRKSDFNPIIDRISNYIDKNTLLITDTLEAFGQRIEKRLDKHEQKIEELQKNKRG